MRDKELKCMFVLIFTTCAIRGEPDCDLHKFDNCTGDVLFYATRTSHPVKYNELKEDCKIEFKSLECIRTFTDNCINGLPQAMMRLLLEGLEKEVHGKCDESVPEHEDYLKHVPCINTVGKGMQQCMKNMAGALEAAMQADRTKRVGMSCCYFSTYEQCLKDTTASACGPEAVQYADKILTTIAGDMLDTVCSIYKLGSANCNKFPALQPIENPTYQTMFPPLLQVMQVLG